MFRTLISITLLMLLVAGCTHGISADATQLDEASRAGFFSGIWHGVIMPFSLIRSMFDGNISIFDPHNSGIFYKIGNLIGCSISAYAWFSVGWIVFMFRYSFR